MRNCAWRTWFFPPTRPVRLWGTPPHPRQWGIAPLHSPIRGATRAAPMSYAKVSSREKGSDRLRGNDGMSASGVKFSNMGLIWLNLASFTPSDEGGNEATVASFGTPSTPTHCASMRPRWPRLASSGVARRGETFNSVAFGCIRLHSFPRTLILTPLPDSQRDARFPPSRERRMRFDVCEQCSNQRAMA